MTFILGIYSIFMMIFFPGAIFLKGLSRFYCFSVEAFSVFKFSLIFGLSLVINFILICALVGFGHYVSSVIRVLGVLEGIVFIGLYCSAFFSQIRFLALLKETFIDSQRRLAATPIQQFIFMTALFLLLVISFNWILSWGSVFGPWDPTISYNRWANDFANNHFPILTWHYPQLLPANWSVSYVLVGALPGGVHLEAFPAAIQGLFFVISASLFWFLFKVEKNSAYLLACIFFVLFSFFMLGTFLNLGYADFALCFFNFLALICMLKSLHCKSRVEMHCFSGLMLVFSFAAAMTKPGGLYTAFALPIVLFYLDHQLEKKKKIKRLVAELIILFLTISPWYIYASFYELDTPHSFGDIFFLVYTLGNLSGVLNHLLNILSYGLPSLICIGWIFIYRNKLPRSWRVLFYAYLPYYGLWVLGFSYDIRNAILLVPILSCCIAYIFSQNGKALVRYYLEKIPSFLVLVAGLIVIVELSLSGFSQANLISSQVELKNKTYDQNMLAYLFSYRLCGALKGKILADDPYYAYLPFLKPYVTPEPTLSYGNNMISNLFISPEALHVFLQKHSDIHYFILNIKYQNLLESDAVKQLFSRWLREGKIILIFPKNREGQSEFYKINVTTDQLFSRT